MRILVTGASGFIGARLCLALSRLTEVVGTYRANRANLPAGITSMPLDVRDADSVAAVVNQIRPDAIIHAAALASLQECEADPREAQRCNGDGAKHVGKAASRVGAKLVYLSTDMVFGGHRSWYTDSEEPEPTCRYGLTKHAGEELVNEECPDSCILRLSLVYGWSANSHLCFTEKMIGALRQNQKVLMFTDEYRTPVLIDDVCMTVVAVLEARLNGVFHVAGPQRISRYDFGLCCARVFGFDEEMIVPTCQDSVEPLRARDCSLLVSPRIQQLACECRGPIEGLKHMAMSEGEYRGPR